MVTTHQCSSAFLTPNRTCRAIVLHSRWTLLLWTIILARILSPESGIAGAEQDSTAKERSEAFTWFGGLEYPDVADATFVRVATGHWSRFGDDPPSNSYRHGFLLNQVDDEFTVLFPDLATETFTRSPPGTAEHERVDVEVANLPEIAAVYLRAVREADDPKPGAWPHRFGERLSERAELFVLAWGCWRKGEDEAAAELYDQALRTPGGRPDNAPPFTFRQELAADIAHAEMWRAVLQFGDAEVPREHLLAAFTRIVKNFPQSEHAARAGETAALLEKMVQEDRGHAEKRSKGKPFEELEQQEQIAELIFQLRDQNGQQWSQPGWCDIFMSVSGEEDSPAHQLVNMGYDAVPGLIEALDDERFTRSVGYHRDFYFSHSVLRVSDCAEAILVRIAGRPFYRATSTSGTMHKDGQAEAIKKDVSAWYAELQKKGEKRVLLEETEVGDERAVYAARRLVKKYTDEALPALIAGARKATEPWERAQLVGLMDQIGGDAPLAFLLEEVASGPSRSSRLAAAKAVHKRGRAEGVAAMIAEWNGTSDEDDDFGGYDDSLVSFLAQCGKVEAIQALGDGLQDRPVDVRLEVVSAFGESGNMSVIASGPGSGLRPGDAEIDERQPELRAAILELLLASLDDTEERTGMSGSWNGKSFSDPRICDIAGYVLNQLDEARYPFDLAGSLEQREFARRTLRNVLRQERGLPEIPIPQPRIIEPVPDEAIVPMLRQYELSTDDAEKDVESRILALGLGALPAVVKRRDELAADDPLRTKLEELARKLSLIVVDVQFAEKSLPPNMGLADELTSWEGKPFEPRAFQGLVTSLTGSLPDGVRGLRLAAVRAADGAGVTLHLDLLNRKRASATPRGVTSVPGDAAPTDRPYGWDYNQSVRLGTKSLLHSSGGGIRPPGGEEDSEFAELLEQVIGAPPNDTFEIRLRMVGEWRE